MRTSSDAIRRHRLLSTTLVVVSLQFAEPLFVFHVGVQPPISTGASNAGEIRVIPFTGGTFEGPVCHGTIADGGSDWQRIRANGTLEIVARYMLRTDDGALLEVRSEGLRSAPPEVLERLSKGEPVPVSEYYFRTFIHIRTADERYSWMNDRMFIGFGERRASEVQITVRALP